MLFIAFYQQFQPLFLNCVELWCSTVQEMEISCRLGRLSFYCLSKTRFDFFKDLIYIIFFVYILAFLLYQGESYLKSSVCYTSHFSVIFRYFDTQIVLINHNHINRSSCYCCFLPKESPTLINIFIHQDIKFL